MKIPERPRSLQDIFKDKIIKNPVFTEDRTVSDRVKQFNEDYLHWDEVRRKDMPQDPEVVWALMKMSRQGQSRHVAFLNTSLTYNTTSRSQRIMHMLDTTASGLLVLEEPLKDSEMKRYVISSLMEEAIASSQLEGAVTT
ncbi:MAG TPA: transposase, partial [Methanomassiliicoccales archaeon]|nr:transposase [Methanomassiliicoccales archaeon]HPR98941.1 transposase [Methanomassiliicoccales archaeon]